MSPGARGECRKHEGNKWCVVTPHLAEAAPKMQGRRKSLNKREKTWYQHDCTKCQGMFFRQKKTIFL